MKISIFGLALLLLGCPPPRGPGFVEGKMLFQFDFKKVSTFKLSKRDPFLNEFWELTATRKQDWILDSASVQPKPLDTLLDTNRIDHVLDTLALVTYMEAAPPGKLDVFQLDPPNYTIEFSNGLQKFNFEVGAWKSGTRQFYARAQAPGQKGLSPPLVVSGTTLSILEHWDKFLTIRQILLVGHRTDDVDLVKIYQGEREILFAERAGEGWVNAKKNPLHRKVTDFLDRLLMAEISRFVDNPSENAERLRDLKTAPTYRIELEGMNLKLSLLLLKNKKGETFATQSSRNANVFELHPKIWIDWSQFFGKSQG